MATKRQLQDLLQRYREAMLDFASELISIPSENPPGQRYVDVVEAIVRCLKQLEIEPEIHGDCILAYVGESDEQTLYFSGHYDVVPAQERSQFKPIVRGKNLFGRGSSDMKSGLVAMTYAAVAVRDSVAKLNGRIGLVFVPDEETTGPRGSRFLEARNLLGRNGIGMLTPEPTGGVIWNANRGAITCRVTTTGKPAHVGRQFEGINAFEGMLKIAGTLGQLKREVERRTTAFEIQPDAARRSILMMGGQTGGGTNFNVVPECCWFTVDRRINPEEDFETEKDRLIAFLTSANDSICKTDWEILQEGQSSSTPADTLLGIALAKNIEATTGTAPRFEMCPGLLETRFYASRGIPAYAYGPGLLTVSHGPNEFVPVNNVFACADIYALTALDLFGTANHDARA